MTEEAEKHIRDKIAKTMAMLCVRNTHIATIHAGKTPVTRIGDSNDATTVEADGTRIPWADLSHSSDDDVRDPMRDMVNRLHTNRLIADEPGLEIKMECSAAAGKSIAFPQSGDIHKLTVLD